MHIFLTGYPGFIGRRMLEALALQQPQWRFTLLVQAPWQQVAQQALKQAGLHKQARCLVGDLTQPNLGLAEAEAWLSEIRQVWHLAAIYDLAVPHSVAWAVNVQGTENILKLCDRLPNLERLMYFSTCYVSGRRTGRILETELDAGQSHKNHYESTKYTAEVLVQAAKARLPITIVRPAIVAGDSTTGETDKYDGPYYIMRLLMRMPKTRLVPMVGNGKATLNIVPVDYIVRASSALAGLSESLGVTVQLADAKPPRIADFVHQLADLLGRPRPIYHAPAWLMTLLTRLPLLREVFALPPESVRYMTHHVTYDTQNARALLEPLGIGCPELLSYLPVLVQYLQEHPNKPFLDGRRY